MNEAWVYLQKHPDKATRILDKIYNTKSFTVTIDEFEDYSASMNNAINIQLVNPNPDASELERREKIQDKKGAAEMFSQVDHMSDKKILELFDTKYDLEGRIKDIGDLPSNEQWYKDGVIAEKKIEAQRGHYDTLLAEEWEDLEHPFDPLAPLMGPIGLLTDIIAGGLDWRHDFKEDLHEKGPFTSWNPLTGFGTWEMAEFQVNPKTGQQGLSPELLQLEEELDAAYSTKRKANEILQERGYSDKYILEEDLQSVQEIINLNKLIDPRNIGESL